MEAASEVGKRERFGRVLQLTLEKAGIGTKEILVGTQQGERRAAGELPSPERTRE